MDLEELRTAVRSVSGVEMTTLRSDAEVNQIIQDAYSEISDSGQWPWLEVQGDVTTVASTSSYTLPATVDRISHVTYFPDGTSAPGHPLREAPRAHLERYGVLDDGDPRMYARAGASGILIAPPPDGVDTVRVHGWADPDPLEDDTDVPTIPEKYHSAIVYAAAAALLNDEGQFDQAEKLLERAFVFIGRMSKEYLLSHDDSPLVMGGAGQVPASSVGKLWPGRV